MRKQRSSWLALGLAGVILAALCLAACGSSSSGTGSASSSSGSVSESDLKRYESELEKLYKGTYTKPVGGPVKPPPGKDVWVVSTGQSIETAQDASKGMEEAGKKLGWKVTVFDGKFESSREITGIEQAIASGAEGIVLLYVDCAPVKSALQQAKAAGVVVVGIESQDCDPSLEYEQKFAGGIGYIAWEHGWGAAQAAWVIAETKGEAKTIVVPETDLAVTRAGAEGWTEQFDKCPTCEIVDSIEFVGTEFGPPLQQKIEQALNKHPEANSFIPAYDAVMTGGGAAAALRASGRLSELKVMGGEGSVPGIELIYNESGSDACVGIPTAWNGYEAMMVLARAFAGQDPNKGNSGIGWQVCNREHNLPPKGEGYQPPIDYVAAYEELWGLK